jgi:hypothetical protein
MGDFGGSQYAPAFFPPYTIYPAGTDLNSETATNSPVYAGPLESLKELLSSKSAKLIALIVFLIVAAWILSLPSFGL